MPTNYPAALDTTTNLPTTIADATTQATNHPAYHNTEDGALIALETKVGSGASIPANGQVLTGGATPGTSSWATPASGFANPMTTAGDSIVGTAGGAAARLAVGATGTVLTVAGGTPTWARAVPVRNVLAYGAVGDGVANDTAAFVAAIAAVPSSSIGGVVDIPVGTYKITSVLDISSKPGIILRGYGRKSYNEGAAPATGSTLVASTAGMTLIKSDNGTSCNHLGPAFENLNFMDGSGSNNCTLVLIRITTHWAFRSCSFRYAGTGVSIDAGTVSAPATVGGDSSWGMFDDCTFYKCNVCVLDASGGWTMIGGDMQPKSYAAAVPYGIKQTIAGMPAIHVIGGKWDGDAADVTTSIGCYFRAVGCQCIGVNFENLAVSVRLDGDPAQPLFARQGNAVIGCAFTSATAASIAIDITANTWYSTAIGNWFNNYADDAHCLAQAGVHFVRLDAQSGLQVGNFFSGVDYTAIRAVTGAVPKLSFFAATPIAQPTRSGALTDSSGGTPNATTIAAVTTFPTAANAIATIAAKYNALELLIKNLGLMG